VANQDFLQEHRRRTIEEHTNLGKRKPVSYLPIKTIEKVLGLTVDEYRKLVELAGNSCAVFSEKDTCIHSGAVYAYSDADLTFVLDHYSGLLAACSWPVSTGEFVGKIAAEWYEEKNPVMPVIRAAFGDLRNNS
jgi:hypothetical protein